jgi:hypothetical protein
MDANLVKQGMPGYQNDIVMPGDSILEVDGVPAEHVPADTLHSLLAGVSYTTVSIVLARRHTFHVYQICVMRHLQHHEHEIHDTRNEEAALSYTHPCNPVAQRVSMRAQRTSMPPQAHQSSPEMTQSLEHSMSHSNFEQRVGMPPAIQHWSPVWDNLKEGHQNTDGTLAHVFEGHTDMINCCAWSTEGGGGKYLLSASSDQSLRLWDVFNRSCLKILEGHIGTVWCCSLSSKDGGSRWALSGSRDKTLRIFDLHLCECVLVLVGHKASVYACKWSVGGSNGRMIISGSADNTLRIWEGETGACKQILEGHTAAVMCCDWSTADGGARWALSGSDDSTVRTLSVRYAP